MQELLTAFLFWSPRLCGSLHLKDSRVQFTVLLTSGTELESSLTPLITMARSVGDLLSHKE